MRSALWVDRFQSSGCHKYPLTPQLNGPVRGTTREGALGHGNGLPPCCRPSCAHGSGDDDGALRSPDDGRGPGYLDQPYLPSIGQGIYGGINLSWGWSGDADGAVGGGQIGYDWQSRQFVCGVGV